MGLAPSFSMVTLQESFDVLFRSDLAVLKVHVRKHKLQVMKMSAPVFPKHPEYTH